MFIYLFFSSRHVPAAIRSSLVIVQLVRVFKKIPTNPRDILTSNLVLHDHSQINESAFCPSLIERKDAGRLAVRGNKLYSLWACGGPARLQPTNNPSSHSRTRLATLVHIPLIDTHFIQDYGQSSLTKAACRIRLWCRQA
jgi:hypothetical protein